VNNGSHFKTSVLFMSAKDNPGSQIQIGIIGKRGKIIGKIFRKSLPVVSGFSLLLTSLQKHSYRFSRVTTAFPSCLFFINGF